MLEDGTAIAEVAADRERLSETRARDREVAQRASEITHVRKRERFAAPVLQVPEARERLIEHGLRVLQVAIGAGAPTRGY